MEAFSLLKYWRTSAGGGGGGGGTTSVFTADSTTPNTCTTAKTVVTAAADDAGSAYSSDGEDGPYFDLEFALPEGESDTEEESAGGTQKGDQRAQKKANEEETDSGTGAEELSENENENDADEDEDDDDEEEEEEGELKFALTSNDCTDKNVLTLSPSDELFFKGNLVSIEPSSDILNGSDENPRFPVSLLKSATKFRVLLLKLKKSKSVNGVLEKAEKSETIEANDQEISSTQNISENQGKISGKFFTVKCKVEEVRMPLVSFFTRDNSSKGKHSKGMKNNPEDSDTTTASDERKLTKEVVQKYLKMVKPLYIRVSKRYVEKLKLTGQLSFSGRASKGGDAISPPPEKGGEVTEATASICVKTNQKQVINNNFQAGLKVVRKHLGKSRSASATVAAPSHGMMAGSRRDDSLLQLHDGIQSAIMHCKRSFNASRDGESSMLSRSVSDPSHEKSVILSTDSSSSSSSSSSVDAKETKV